MNLRNDFIDSTMCFCQQLKESRNLVVKTWEARKSMKDILGMRYRKVKPASWHINSDKNLVLR